MAKPTKTDTPPSHFSSVLQSEVPQGRNGKHKEIVSRIVSELRNLSAGRALRIPLSELPDSKENIRSALNRVTRQLQMDVSTSSDSEHIYVWKTGEKAA